MLGAARVLPSIVLVPAFGLRALPVGARLGLALTLGLCVAPALSTVDHLQLGLGIVLEVLRGMPVALSAAFVLWSAGMAGGLVHELRFKCESSQVPITATDSGPIGALFAIIAACAFLETGGPVRIVTALSRQPAAVQSQLTQLVGNLLSGVHVAIAIAVPFLIASILIELVAGLLARLAPLGNLHSLWAQVKSVFLLLLLAALLERIWSLIGLIAARAT